MRPKGRTNVVHCGSDRSSSQLRELRAAELISAHAFYKGTEKFCSFCRALVCKPRIVEASVEEEAFPSSKAPTLLLCILTGDAIALGVKRL